MGNTKLPEGWTKSHVKDCFQFLKTASFSRADMCQASSNLCYIHYGEIHKYPYRIFDFKKHFCFKLKEGIATDKYDLLSNGDLIIADVSEDYEGIGVCNEISNLNTNAISGLHTFALRPTNQIAAGFALLLFQNQNTKLYLKKIATGISVLGISKANLGKAPVYLPPLSEQKKIADTLQTWDTAIEKTDALINAKEKYFKWLVAKLFNDLEQLEIPKKMLSEFMNPTAYVHGDINATVAAVGKKGIRDRAEIYSKDLSADYSKNKLVYKDEVVFGLANKNIVYGVNKTSIVYSVSPAYKTFKIAGCNSTFLEYLLYIHNKRLSLKFLITSARQGKAIDFEGLLKEKFIFPDISVQNHIADTLNTAQQEINLLKKLAEQYRTQKRGLMQKLLTGEWRLK